MRAPSYVHTPAFQPRLLAGGALLGGAELVGLGAGSRLAGKGKWICASDVRFAPNYTQKSVGGLIAGFSQEDTYDQYASE